MKKARLKKAVKYLNTVKAIFFITFVINVLLFAYKHESKVEHANYKILVQESEGSSNYVEYEGSSFPKSGYVLSSYECSNNGTVTQTSSGTFSFTGNSDSCTLKFDISIPTYLEDGHCTFGTDSSGGGGNANMSGLTLMMKNASQGEDDESWFTDSAANQGQAGVYTRKGTNNDAYPIYYYRGAYGEVNNNLIFNNYCWKIVRTTATGSVRILYNGPSVNNTCPNQTGDSTMIGKYPFNSSYNDPKYVGYRYDNNGTMTDSNLKMTLDTWYSSNMSSVDSKVETSTYCNDTTTLEDEDFEDIGETPKEGSVYYCPYYRVKKGQPTTKCKQASDEYSGKVGFLTVDEEILAGRSATSGMQDYLYNSSYYWLGSPGGFYSGDSGGAFVFLVYRGYEADRSNYVHISRGVRPVVSLSPNTSYTGSGTTTDPFIVN